MTPTDVAPRFSVVVPAYNAEETLAETLEALSAQTFPDWECVVVDDGSVDGTLRLAAAYSDLDPRVRVVSQENRGTGGAYNTGVQAARGSWVSICSADDVLLPSHLSTMNQAVDRHPGVSIFTCNGYYWLPSGDKTLAYPGDSGSVERSWSLEELLEKCFFSVGACYRRSLYAEVGGYQEDIYGEDYDFWLRAMASGAQHLYVPVALSLHRVSATQKSSNLLKAFESDIESIRRLDTRLLSRSQRRAVRRAIRHRRIMIHQLVHPRSLLTRAISRIRLLRTGRREG